jgi:hypothetical protein
MMSRGSALVFVLGFAVLVAACGGGAGDSSGETPTTTAGASTTTAGASTTTVAAATTTTTTEPELEGLADGDYLVSGSFSVTDVGDPPQDLPQDLAVTGALKPYERWILNDEEVRPDEDSIIGTMSCAAGVCTFDFKDLPFSGFKGWRFTSDSIMDGGMAWFGNFEVESSASERVSSATEDLFVENPQPLVLTDDGYETAFAGIATCGEESTEVMVSLLFDGDDLLGEPDEFGVLRVKVGGALEVDAETWGREEGDGWAVCWLPSVTFEPRERASDS